MSSPVASVPGCLPRSFDSQKLLTVFGMVVASQLLIVIMSTVVTYLHYQTSESPLLTVFYRDGFFYFVSLSCEYQGCVKAPQAISRRSLSNSFLIVVTVGNIIFNRVGPVSYHFDTLRVNAHLYPVAGADVPLHLVSTFRSQNHFFRTKSNLTPDLKASSTPFSLVVSSFTYTNSPNATYQAVHLPSTPKPEWISLLDLALRKHPR